MDGKALVDSVKREVIEPGIRRLMDSQYFTEMRQGKLSIKRLQGWAIQQSDDEKVALRAKWIERGGEIVRLPAADMVELQTRLKPIGADITKSDPNLKAFYEKVLATAAKY